MEITQPPARVRSGGFQESSGDQASLVSPVEPHPEDGTVEDLRETGGGLHHRAELITEPAERGTHPRTWFKRAR